MSQSRDFTEYKAIVSPHEEVKLPEIASAALKKPPRRNLPAIEKSDSVKAVKSPESSRASSRRSDRGIRLQPLEN